jgi:exosortase E/protease (VPEID-CTERM system)
MLIARSDRSCGWSRVCSALALFAVVLVTTGLFADLPDVWDKWPVIGFAHAAPKCFLLALPIFMVVAWPKRQAVFAAFDRRIDDGQSSIAAVVSSTALLLALFFRQHVASGGEHETLFAYAYSASIVIAAAGLVLVAAPVSFWRAILKFSRAEVITAIVFSVGGFTIGEVSYRERGSLLSEQSWNALSGATLDLSYAILRLFDSTAFMDSPTRVLGARTFSVQVFAACSGYEGMMLIAAFLAGYLFMFRKTLRFPNALLLFPVAMATIWLLNGFRIAMLVYIGANFSPAIALDGFHSQFGWLSFLLVAITIMTFAQKISFFGSDRAATSAIGQHVREQTRERRVDPTLVYLAPFCALMAGQIITRMGAPHEHLLYPIKVIAVGIVLFVLRDLYLRIWTSPSAIAVILGALAGVAWIATDPSDGAPSKLAEFVAGLPPLALIAWLAFRGLGTIVMVPIAEELAFRGFLYRTLISTRFEAVSFRAFGLIALIVSSALFGFMHERWLSGALAGMLYALVMIRRGQLSDAIVAHMTTNAVIFGWAIANDQWSLL